MTPLQKKVTMPNKWYTNTGVDSNYEDVFPFKIPTWPLSYITMFIQYNEIEIYYIKTKKVNSVFFLFYFYKFLTLLDVAISFCSSFEDVITGTLQKGS